MKTLEKEIYLHTGMPKCSSTFLQKEVFPHLKGFYYTELQHYQKCPFANFLNKAVYANPLTFDIQKESKEAMAFLAQRKEKKILISWEGLYGCCFNNSMNSLFLSKLLKTLFPTAKVLLVIRRQDNLLNSLYKQVLKQHHTISVDHFLNYKSGEFQRFKPAWWIGMNVDVRSFDFYAIVKQYRKMYGATQVFCIPYELLPQNKSQYLQDIFDFLKCKGELPAAEQVVNQGLSQISAPIARRLNGLVKSGFNPLGFIPANGPLDPVVWLKKLDKLIHQEASFIDSNKKEKIMSFYQSSNKKLDRWTPYDLKEYGYYST